MTRPHLRRARQAGRAIAAPRPAPLLAAVAAAGLAAATLGTAAPAAANPDGSALVISEVYGGGGNAGAPYTSDFVELYNPTAAAVPLDGMSVQYRSAAGNLGAVTPLTGSVPAGAHWLVAQSGGTTGAPLPTPDASGSASLSATNGIVVLASSTVAVPTDDASVLDLVGYGSATAFEGAATPALSNTTSAARSATGADTDHNDADLTVGAPTPEASGGGGPTEPQEPTPHPIAEIQGTGATSPLAGQDVVTDGVVTASYPTGGLRGFYLQTPGTGGALDLGTHLASDAVFVYLAGADAAAFPARGAHVQVTGRVSEFAGLTELTPATADAVVALPAATAPVPAQVAWPSAEAERESLEGMLYAPRGRWTVTDNFSLNRFAEIGLARGSRALPAPTDVARPGPAADAVAADNAARLLTLDDGASTDFLPFGGGASQDVPLPYLTPRTPVRVGSPAVFTRPVVVDYRNDLWKVQPTEQLTAANARTVQPATFPGTRPARPDRVGGDVQVASFNVLNYFTETGADWEAAGGDCDFFVDRDDAPVTVDGCDGEGPRGAADDANLARQQAKIVAAINTLGADVLSLEEIENSAKYAGPDHRDDALATLVRALNRDAGRPRWAFVPSPPASARPAVADEDVIRTAFIYQPAAVRPVGSSRILVGDPAFDNAREPLAQQFAPRGASPAARFVVVVNHFKSKGSGVDDGTGQGASNPDRVAQATALEAFAADVAAAAHTDRVLLTGDFNSYTQEDPLQVLYDAGYTDIGEAFTDESTYLFDGLVGSLDHVLASPALLGDVTGADVWNINSPESVAFEYSRRNYNATQLYAPTPFRASDHDPLLVGLRTRGR